tara:strand:- start:1579 stop:1728 length:150 start_codon:yes stop_codon:yes gene_type:complete
MRLIRNRADMHGIRSRFGACRRRRFPAVHDTPPQPRLVQAMDSRDVDHF